MVDQNLSFRRWLDHARITNDPVGDFVTDARRDPELPGVQSLDALRAHVRERGGCQEAIDVAPQVWKRFRQWQNQRAKNPGRTGTHRDAL